MLWARERLLALVLGVVAFGPIPAVAAPQPAPAGTLTLLPARVLLDGPRARQQLAAQVQKQGATTADVTAAVRFRSLNPKVVRVTAAGLATPVADGKAEIAAVRGRETVRVPVEVRGVRRPFTWSFENHVQPVLTRAGCNSGACHGALAGKGGLKLTLRGYDPEADYLTLTRQAMGRRIVPSAPARSLVLQKPAGDIPHGGGVRFRPGSREYAVLAQWIAAGMPGPGRAVAMRRLEVLPAALRLSPGQKARLLVRAHFADGRVEDVTPWVKFGSSDESVAAADEAGEVAVKGPGETAVTVWYLNQVTFARVSVPYPKPVPASVFAAAERHNAIDDLVLRKLQTLNIPPATPADDAVFLRRLYLDAAGILPTPEEVTAFLADSRPDRRERAVDALLARAEFVDYWAYKWSDLLLVSSRKLSPRAMWAYYRWIRDSVAQNKPWNRFARELLTAAGSNYANGATNYFVLHKDPIDLTETTTQAFLGMSLTCARCHNHPLEKWTQNDYYGMANLFARVRIKNGDQGGELLTFATPDGDVPHPRTGQPMPPRPLDGLSIPLDAPGDRREHLAAWLTGPGDPYFARALINRVWRNFMGRGLVEAEDDLRLTNPPSNEELMAALERDFVSNGYDVRRLIRLIVTSATYQRSSVLPAGAPADPRYYASYLPRRLPAEVLLDSISQVTGVPTTFAGYERGTRAMQLPDAAVANEFLAAFGRPQRVQTCSCERTEEPNVAQALHLSNGDTINEKLRSKGGLAERLSAPGLSDEQVLEQVYLIALGRRPTEAERKRVLAAFAEADPAAGGRREAVEDLIAAVLLSKEFLFNH